VAFSYRSGVLCADDLPLDEVARRFGTPSYVYSGAAIEAAYQEYAAALAGREALVCYSVKANSNLAILALLAKRGAGFDIVSGGELARVIAAGGDPGKTLFSGVGKSDAEIRFALEKGIGCINLESEAELTKVDAIAGALGKRAPIAFRVNPDIDARTHPYISTGLRENKFGVAHADAERLYRTAASLRNVEVVGIGCHIGSQLTQAAPLTQAASRVAALADRIERAGIALRHIDIGGGIGIRYRDEPQEPIASFLDGTLGVLAGRKEQLILDPGRSLVGNAGVLLTRVEYVKSGEAKNFLVVDAAMNDLIRPALYGAWHEVKTVRESAPGAAVYDVVGPVCESGDFLARERRLSAREGDLLAIMSAGAYSMAMSSNYNTRPRAAEVLVTGGAAHLVRRRESVEDLFALERIPA
jgi:diaminopimelate decarboxylase